MGRGYITIITAFIAYEKHVGFETLRLIMFMFGFTGALKGNLGFGFDALGTWTGWAHLGPRYHLNVSFLRRVKLWW